MLDAVSGLTFFALSARSNTDFHPDLNTVSAFFLGCVFVTAVHSIFTSALFGRFLNLFLTRRRHRRSQIYGVSDVEKSSLSRTSAKNGEGTESGSGVDVLIFIMVLSFGMGAIADLSSLSSMSTDGLCAFLVSWGVMAAKLGRLLGLMTLLVSVYLLGIPRWEFALVAFWSLVAFALILVDGALNTGTLRMVQNMGTSFCFRKHVLAISIVTTFVYLLLEVYLIARLSLLLLPHEEDESKSRALLHVFRDYRLKRGFALLFFELLVLVPSAINTNTAGELIPFSIGTIVVLLAFTPGHQNPGLSQGDQSTDESTLITPWRASRFVARPPGKPHLTVGFPLAQPGLSATTFYPGHPYSNASLDNPHVLRTDYAGPAPASSISEISYASSRARSVQNATVQRAELAKSIAPHISYGPGMLSDMAALYDYPPTDNATPTVSRRPTRSNIVITNQGQGQGQGQRIYLSALPSHLIHRLSRKGRPDLTVITNFTASSSSSLPIIDNGTSDDHDHGTSAVATMYTFYSNSPHAISAPLKSHFSLPSPSTKSFTNSTVTRTASQRAESADPTISTFSIRRSLSRKQSGQSAKDGNTEVSIQGDNDVGAARARITLPPPVSFKPKGPRVRMAAGTTNMER